MATHMDCPYQVMSWGAAALCSPVLQLGAASAGLCGASLGTMHCTCTHPGMQARRNKSRVQRIAALVCWLVGGEMELGKSLCAAANRTCIVGTRTTLSIRD